MSMLTLCASLAGFSTPAKAEETEGTRFYGTYNFNDPTREVNVTLEYSSLGVLEGEVEAEIHTENNEETLKKFEKYVRKKIDSADVGEVIYVTMTPTNAADAESLQGDYKFTVKLPKFYKNKDLAVMPFTDYRSPQNVKSVTKHSDGSISFEGTHSAYAYVICYNGVYKQIICIAIIMVIVLAICILVKIYCLRKDNPEFKEKKKEKAIAKKKAPNKQNKKLAQALKRERDKLKHNKKE